MSRVRVAAFSISLDGFGAGPQQSLDQPLGIRGMELHQWFFRTRTFNAMHGGGADGSTGVDDQWAARGFENVGAWILGRNMFGPVRGPWSDESWRGWWGDSPPYHVPVFVLTHYPRPDLVMSGGTTFHFVTNGPAAALQRARGAAGGKDVRIGGGVATIRQFLAAGQVDELHLALAPVFLGEGEPLFAGLDWHNLGLTIAQTEPGEGATHIRVVRRA